VAASFEGTQREVLVMVKTLPQASDGKRDFCYSKPLQQASVDTFLIHLVFAIA
jgi:hypothetical protein